MVFAVASHGELTMDHGSVRAMPPGHPNTAAFMALHNTFDHDVVLVGVSSDVASIAEFHQHEMSANGVMSMHRVNRITIKAGECFEFKSGDHHIMLMGLTQSLRAGESINLHLQDDQQQQYHFMIPVVSLVSTPTADHSHP